MSELIFTIPTYRHNEVHRCVEEYLRNFNENGHDIPIAVFDDSSKEQSRTTVANLEQVKKRFPNSKILYVGFEEKLRYLDELEKVNHDTLIKEMLRPSYGGNRNWILLATLGNHFISVDDDMHPYGIINPSTKENFSSVLEGTYTRDLSGFGAQTMDIISAYASMIGKKVGAYLSQNNGISRGRHLIDSNMDLMLNMTSGEMKDNHVTVSPGEINIDAKIKIVQTFLSGDADIDSKDLVSEFIKSGSEEAFRGVVPLKYVVKNFESCIVEEDYRLTGAVLGLDNTEGFICFLPTKLRFEDYIFRTYSRKPDIHVGYCHAVQTHTRAMANRNNIVQDFVIEGIATLIKKSIINGIKGISDLEVKLEKDPSYDVKELYSLWNTLMDYSRLADPNSPHGQAFIDAVKNEAMSTESKGQFVATFTKRIDEEYTRIRNAINVWPKLVDYASQHPIPQRMIH